MASARPYPPSAQRIAEARASGQAPRPLLAASTSALLFVLAGGWLVGPRALAHLQAFWKSSAMALARGDDVQAYAQLAALVDQAAPRLALTLLGLFVTVLAAELLGRGASFARVRTRLRLTPVRRDVTALLVWSVGLTLLVSFAVLELVPRELAELGPLASDWSRRLALLALVCLALDVTLARARFFGSLWMTRGEQLDEQRAAFGPPEIRRALTRVRSEARREEA